MSIWDSNFYYTRAIQQDAPAWFRNERYDYCEGLNESTVATKRGIFGRLAGKKRGK